MIITIIIIIIIIIIIMGTWRTPSQVGPRRINQMMIIQNMHSASQVMEK